MHADTAVSDCTKTKPNMINYYDKYKTSVDNMDQMVEDIHPKASRSSRWPVAIFYNMLDMASLATYLIYFESKNILRKKTTKRRFFYADSIMDSNIKKVYKEEKHGLLFLISMTTVKKMNLIDIDLKAYKEVSNLTFSDPSESRMVAAHKCFIYKRFI
ncbi:hypothetical protein WA026_008236 [Henosepilachna vigintioctopunctata]|uniref:PiggyBac transposable element-derived protein domain-containing protein n=1 Tax=Henosepilachna vigintioctopunctata TaxID=420089 RepID=A0AAW1TSD1_9CUCU